MVIKAVVDIPADLLTKLKTVTASREVANKQCEDLRADYWDLISQIGQLTDAHGTMEIHGSHAVVFER